ncbi:MAG: hypothetical protein O3C02_01865 [Cyanobacteria bacterium]|nr:hypothetical protein [Cyanobacteriota bacterium]MDA0963790.1 hypothetical protein [Cyanobacteriota bacterium]MDA1156250.1 hypothetical protein [Cyanobacteriota bacterium]
MEHILHPVLWALQVFGLFIAFTVQGAMWKGAQDHGDRGWVVALVWAVGSVAILNAMHVAHDAFLPEL